MADIYSQRSQAIILHVHNSFVFSFNTLLINLARQHLPAPSPHSILAFIVSVLVALIQIKFPGISMLSSPFETHRTTTMVAIASLLAYCSAVAARLRFPTYSPTNFRLAIIFSALLSVASLLSLLVPDSWHHIPYVIFIFYYLMAEGFGLLQKLCQRRVTRAPTLLPVTVVDIHGFAVRDTRTWSFN
ncbi:hypothetical protein GBA52_007386 [Prunus armeniaca]|nr:hypothetical protein GBA52_007386 [Prunus armeniaca]